MRDFEKLKSVEKLLLNTGNNNFNKAVLNTSINNDNSSNADDSQSVVLESSAIRIICIL